MLRISLALMPKTQAPGVFHKIHIRLLEHLFLPLFFFFLLSIALNSSSVIKSCCRSPGIFPYALSHLPSDLFSQHEIFHLLLELYVSLLS